MKTLCLIIACLIIGILLGSWLQHKASFRPHLVNGDYVIPKLTAENWDICRDKDYAIYYCKERFRLYVD